MRKVLIALGILVILLIALPVGFLIYLCSGPTAPAPTEDPAQRLNREHAGLGDNAAGLYEAAFAALKGEPQDDWTGKNGWKHGDSVPAEAVAWVAENAEAIEKGRTASRCANCWFQHTRDETGSVDLPHLKDMRRLTKLFYWRALAALDERDLATLMDSLEVAERMARHTSETPALIPQLVSVAILAVPQYIILEPYTWEELAPADRRAYAARVQPCLTEPPSLADAIRFDRDAVIWWFPRTTDPMFVSMPRFLASPERLAGEFQRSLGPTLELAAQPLDQQLDRTSPLRRRVDALKNEPPFALNFPRVFANMLTPSLTIALDIRARVIARQRGNHTVIELFAIRDQTGQFPVTLDAIDGDFKIDPFSGQPFVYRLTDDGFTLYSVGYDRDDDGGAHHRRFGDRRGTRDDPDPPPDGDYVFWPIPKREPEDDPDDPD